MYSNIQKCIYYEHPANIYLIILSDIMCNCTCFNNQIKNSTWLEHITYLFPSLCSS